MENKRLAAEIFAAAAFVGNYSDSGESFPFAAIKEFRRENDELSYSGVRIVALIEKSKGTVIFRMNAYKGIFLIDEKDQDRLQLDQQIIDAVSSALAAHA